MATKDQIDPSRLREALEHAGMSSADLADELGVSASYVSQWLNGHRPCPPKYINKIVNQLSIERSWLTGNVHSLSPENDNLSKARWSYRETPSDGGRDYGSADVWTLPADIKTLVRETLQNSMDNAARHAQCVSMRYRVIEIEKDSDEYESFMQAIDFENLSRHIRAASETSSRLATRLKTGLKRLQTSTRLYLLRIDDFGTTGLYGEETSSGDSTNPFAALVRNSLDSSKRSRTAGGSFGLGKAVLWRCSELSTVLFASDIVPEERLEGQPDGVRFTGKTELTWHKLDMPDGRTEEFAGPGWFGAVSSGGDSDKPSSMWVSDEALRPMHLNRDGSELPLAVPRARQHGTTALIVGFRDPSGQEIEEPGALVEKIAQAAAESFWPAMVRDNLSVTVERAVNGSILQRIPEVDPHDYVPEFCDALVKHRKGEVEEDLSEAGDVVRTEITHRVPAVDEEASGLEPFQSDLNARAELLVRLANDSDDHLVSRVAMFRGRQMVVKYWRRKNIVVGGRPFHAVLLAGEAVETGSSGDPQVAADQFLRMAEPPAHDDWKYNDEIRANFAWGAKARLDELFGDVTRALKKIVRPRKSDEQTDAPRELQRLLQISGGTAASSAAVTLRRVRGNVEDGQWHLEAEIHVKERAKAWDVTPALRIVPESGKHLHVPWEHFELIAPERGQAVMKGERTLRIEPRTRKVRFKATAVRKVEGVIAGFCKTKVELQITQASRDGGE